MNEEDKPEQIEKEELLQRLRIDTSGLGHDEKD